MQHEHLHRLRELDIDQEWVGLRVEPIHWIKIVPLWFYWIAEVTIYIYLLILRMELLRVCTVQESFTSLPQASQPDGSFRALVSSDRDNIHGDHQASVYEGALWYLPRLLCRYNILQRVRDETHLFHILSAISSTQLQCQEIKTSQV